MKTYISLLRGINVSGKNKIKMVDLKALYEAIGAINVTTYIQSGNVVFKSKLKVDTISKKIKDKIFKAFNYDVNVLTLEPKDIDFALNNNPYLKRCKGETKMLYVTFLNQTPDKEGINELDAVASKNDELKVDGNKVFVFVPGGYGATKLSNTFIEKKLNCIATTRNWRTLNKIKEMIQ